MVKFTDGLYYHSGLGKKAAEELLIADGGESEAGKFLFRRGKEANASAILTVIYKGMPTHHNIAATEDGGELTINKRPASGCTNLSELHEYLKTKQPGWPVPLKGGVEGGGGGGGGGSSALAPAPSGGGGDGGDGDFLHGAIPKAKANELLAANGGEGKSGKFLFRAATGGGGNAFVLSVMYKGAPTHHPITRDGAGSELVLNKNPTGQTSLADLHEYLKTKQPKWPVPLTEGVPSGGGGGVKRALTKRRPAAAAPTAAAPSSSGSAPLDGNGLYFFPSMNKAGAEELLLADGGAGESGKFLFRSQGDSAEQCYVSVIYRGMPTHHQLAKVGAEYTLNKNRIPCKNLEDVATYLAQKRPKWPVPLNPGVPNPDRAGGGGGGGGGGSSAPTKQESIEVEEVIDNLEAEIEVPKKGGWEHSERMGADGPLGFGDLGADGPLGFDDEGSAVSDTETELAARRGPIGKVEKRSWITDTWRRQKLESLEDKPNNFGAWGNLITDQQASAMGNSPPPMMAGGAKKRPSLFQNDSNGFQIDVSPTAQSRMDSGSITDNASGGGTQACTFLGNCTCPDCDYEV